MVERMICLSRVLKCDYVIMEGPSAIYDEPALSSIKIGSSATEISEIQMKMATENADIIINNALKKAEEIRLQSQTEAQNILKEAVQIKENAYSIGYEQGVETGVQQGEKMAEEDEAAAVMQLQEAANRLEECHSDIDESIFNQAVDFSFYLAEKIVNLQIDKNDEAFLNICKNAVSHIGESSSATIRVGSREYEIVTRFQKELKKSINGLENLEIELEDDKNGYCIIETSVGSIDASVGTQLYRAKQMLNMETDS
jgi:flagellar assembly protein FliH